MARSAEAPAGSDVDIESTLLTSLSETPYGCSSLVPLKAGVANTSYRGRLQCPLANGSETIVVKHYRTLADVENAILLPQSRARIESGFLDTMKDTCFTVSNVSLRTPRHFHFDPETETEVMEDITQCDTLRDYLLSDAGRNISSATAASIGECIGGWLADFHARDWSHLDEVFSAALHRNSAILSSLHHHILEHVLATFDDPAVREGAHEAIKVLDEARPVVNHGDFTTRNILIKRHLPSAPYLESPSPIALGVVDWEACERSSPTLDLASMVAGLYIHHQLEGSKASGIILQGFIHGYGPLDSKTVYQAAVMTGLHLLVWDAFCLVDRCHVDALRSCACDMIVRGHQQDQQWLRQSFLRGLFQE